MAASPRLDPRYKPYYPSIPVEPSGQPPETPSGRRVHDFTIEQMRTYLASPREDVGWKGLTNNPDIDHAFGINKIPHVGGPKLGSSRASVGNEDMKSAINEPPPRRPARRMLQPTHPPYQTNLAPEQIGQVSMENNFGTRLDVSATSSTTPTLSSTSSLPALRYDGNDTFPLIAGHSSAYTPGPATYGIARRKQVRAQQACNNCRQRKHKCDEGRPCGYCKQENLNCEYRGVPPPKTDRHIQEIMDKLTKIDLPNTAEDASGSFDPFLSVEPSLRRQLAVFKADSDVVEGGVRDLEATPNEATPTADLNSKIGALANDVGSEEMRLFQTTADNAPITKPSLSELDISSIINNAKVRYDINFDRELHFLSNLDESRGLAERRAKRPAVKHWEALSQVLSSLVSLPVFELQRENFGPAPSLFSTDVKALSIKKTGGVHMKRHLSVPGSINGRTISAFPDTGAEQTSISLTLATNLSLPITRSTRSMFLLPSAKQIQSIGTVEIPWTFEGENMAYNITCAVLPKCTHDLILGGGFLRQTKTLMKEFKHRIKEFFKPFPQRLGVKLLGSEKQRAWGTLNGHFAEALPDLGSDVTLLSEGYAHRSGFAINRSKSRQIELEFADGSRCFTDGVVDGLDWAFGNTEACFHGEFYVLKDLPVDVVLSNDVLYETDAFDEYESFFYQAGGLGDTDLFELGIIRQVGWFSEKLHKLFGESTVGPSTDFTQEHDIVAKEMLLREEIADAIRQMEPERQAEAWQLELQRRAKFEEKRKRMVLQNALSAQTSASGGSSASPASSGNSTAGDRQDHVELTAPGLSSALNLTHCSSSKPPSPTDGGRPDWKTRTVAAFQGIRRASPQ